MIASAAPVSRNWSTSGALANSLLCGDAEVKRSCAPGQWRCANGIFVIRLTTGGSKYAYEHAKPTGSFAMASARCPATNSTYFLKAPQYSSQVSTDGAVPFVCMD